MTDQPTALNTGVILRQAIALHQAGATEQAASLYGDVLAVNPSNHDALHLLGLILCGQGDPATGIRLIERAVGLAPDFVPAIYNLGIELARAGRLDDAVARQDQAIARDPGHADAIVARARALQALGRGQEAADGFGRGAALRPDDAGLLALRGDLLWELDRLAEAQADLEAALAIDPENVVALLAMGNVLQERGQYEAAIASYDRVCALRPDLVQVWMNRGAALQAAGRVTEALAGYDYVLTLVPDHPDARFNQGLCHLQAGDLEPGWAGYEWRWRLPSRLGAFDHFGCPIWDGTAGLSGKRILLHGEQGFGDTIQFCRFVPLVAGLGATVFLGVQPGLKRWMTGLDGVSLVLEQGDPRPGIDLHCSLMSLPAALRIGLDAIPAAIPYLTADPARTAFWRARLTALAGPRVGIVWAGDARAHDRTAFRMDRRRSMPATTMARLTETPGITFVSLQKGGVAWKGLTDWTVELADFAETAALVAALDLVIAVDTSVVHVAGALGVPVWVMNRYDRCWRWMRDSAETPWYPSMRLFTQPEPGDWETVIDVVVNALRDWRAKGV